MSTCVDQITSFNVVIQGLAYSLEATLLTFWVQADIYNPIDEIGWVKLSPYMPCLLFK